MSAHRLASARLSKLRILCLNDLLLEDRLDIEFFLHKLYLEDF